MAVTEPYDQIPASLVKALTEQTVIPFIGAGVPRSVVCKNSSRPLFPSWNELLVRAADALEHEALLGEASVVRGMLLSTPPEYLEAAKRAKAKLGARWTNFLRNQFEHDHQSARPDSLALARCIWRLGSQLVITTNYDSVLKWACPSPADHTTWRTNSTAELARLQQGLNVGPGRWPRLPTVWHLHGHIDEAAELVLAPDGYSRLYSSDHARSGYLAALDTLCHLLVGRTFLFIGFSLDDEAFVETLRSVNNTYSGCGSQHFALARNSDASKMQERVAGLPVQVVRFSDFGAPMLGLMQQLCTHVPTGSALPLPLENTSIQELAQNLPEAVYGATVAQHGADNTTSASIQSMEHNTVTPHDISNANTQLVGHFFDLTPQKREDIAKQLGLLPADYESLGKIELIRRIFSAARRTNCLADLWTVVEQLHPEGTPAPNPYTT